MPPPEPPPPPWSPRPLARAHGCSYRSGTGIQGGKFRVVLISAYVFPRGFLKAWFLCLFLQISPKSVTFVMLPERPELLFPY